MRARSSGAARWRRRRDPSTCQEVPPIGKPLSLTAADAHKLGAYRADPAGKSRRGVVGVQEIFGVNHHIRSVCDRLAALGYAAVVPAVFDRFVRDFETGYSPDEIAKARGYLGNIDW